MSNESKINIGYWLNGLLVVSLCWLSSCGTTKYLNEEEAFVQQNTVKIENEDNVEKIRQLEADLLGIVLQKPNTRFFGINRRWFYYRNKKKGKLKGPQKAGDRHIYEFPSIYNDTLSDKTVESMNYYLKDRGYFHPSISYDTEIEKQHAQTTYTVRLGKLYTIDTIRYISPDTTIQKVLNEISSNTVLKKGVPVSNQLYEEEKRRITNTLRNRGFREFYVNYIDQLSVSAETDTATTSELALSLTVFPRKDGTAHQKYQVGQITILPYYNPSQEILADTLIDGVLFRYSQHEPFPIKPSVILKRIALQKDSLYSQEKFSKTVRNLGALGIFKFANVNDQLSGDSTNIIDFNIYLPANKKIVLGADIEIRNTFSSTNAPTNVTGNFLGGVLNLSYRNRNLFRGSEDFQANFQIGGEFGRTNATESQFFRSYDINPRFELNIPKFSDPLRIARLSNRLGFFSPAFYNSLIDNATTRISFGLNWSSRRNFWGFFSGDFALGYTLNNNPNRQYYLNQIGFSFFDPDIGPNAQVIFDNNPFLERSFNSKQLFTGLLFRDFGLTFSDHFKRSKDSWRVKFTTEVSGLEVAGINGIVNLFRDKEDKVTFRLFDLDYSKFARFEFDGSYYKYISARETLAFRLNTAVAFSYAQTSDVPYVKQYFAGGPTSVRAWKIRELGPGGYQDPSTFPEYGSNTTPFYQTGNFKFIFSAEYRIKLFKVYSLDLEGAIFLDGGNIWTLRSDPDRPNAELDEDFLKQIALGTGVGFRMDFDYFKLAFDLGYRVRNPYTNPEGSYWAYQRWRELKWRGINYNLSVGYPF